jgi:hypothetical protein
MKSNKCICVTLLLCCVIALMPSCSTSVLVHQWADASYTGPSLTSILIVAVRKDPVKRRVWEDAFAGELAKHGVNAVQSYRLFSGALPDSGQIVDAVAKSGFDGIIITRRLPKAITTQYVNGYVSQEIETKYSERKQRFFTYYRDVEHPGYVDTQNIANRSIDVWTADSSSRMIWSAVSETPEPATPEAVHQDVVTLVTDDLARRGIIPNAQSR